MSEIRVNKLIDEAGTGAVELTQGATLPSGKTISGSGTIAVNSSGTAAGLSGAPDITINNLVGVAATFTGVLTYEDVTNVDSVGIVTARTGIKVLAGGADIVGVTTTKGGLTTQKLLKEEVNVTAGKLSENLNIYLENGCVHIFTTAESAQSVPAIKYSSGVNLKDMMSVGESVVVTLITTANASAWSAQITIDGDAVTENWVGGTAPSDGGSSGVDIHTFTIIKVASSGTTDQQLTVIANHSKTS
jgi:hypothetical protein